MQNFLENWSSMICSLDLGFYYYILSIISLFICGIGIPVPRNLILVITGLLAGTGQINVHIAFLLCLLTITGTDLMLFYLGKRQNFMQKLMKFKIFRKLFPIKKVAKGKKLFAMYGSGIILTGSFIPGLRTIIYIICGMNGKISMLKFLLLDSLSTFIMVPLWIYTSYLCAGNFPKLWQTLEQNNNYALILMCALICISILICIRIYLNNKYLRN